MGDYFILSADRENDTGQPKLLSYSGTAKDGKMVLTLKVEVGGYDLGYFLKSLEAIKRANNAKPKAPKALPAAKQRAICQTKTLALPAPDQFEA